MSGRVVDDELPVRGVSVAKRTVRFYEIVNARKERLPEQIPFEGLRNAIRDLDNDEAYVELARMELLGSAYDGPRAVHRSEPLIALDRITRDVHLRIERRRNYRPLALEEDENLAEPSFFTIFDRNVLGVMRNSGSAPGPASFRDYVNTLGLLTEDIDVVPLADSNSLRALRDVDRLTRVVFAVGADVNAEVFGSSSPLVGGAVRQIRQQLGFVAIEVSLKLSPISGREANELALKEVSSLVTSDSMGYVDKAEIGYKSMDDGRSHSYDFIDEAVATQTEVELNDTLGQPTEASASEAMAEAYDLLYEDIRSALNAAGK